MVTALHHRVVETNGIRMHAVTGGHGPPLYMLHGWPQTWLEWRDIAARFMDSYTVVLPDLRGFGDSERPTAGYDVATQAVDIAGVADSLGHDGLVVAAHDLGGPVAYALAALRPDLVAGLVLFEAPLFGIGGPGIPDYARDLWHVPFHAARDLAEALIAGRELLYVEHFFTEFAYDKAAFAPELVREYARQLARPGALRGGLEHYRAIETSAAQIRKLAERPLSIPVFGFGGSHSLGAAVHESVKRVAHDAGGGIIDMCGHWVCEERPDDVERHIRAAIAATKGRVR